MTTKDLQNIKAVFKREFFAYVNSPVLYVIIVIFLLTAMGFAFLFGGFLRNGNASLNQAFFFWHPWIYMVLAPAVGMRLWSEEHRLGTVELLMTFPISPWSAVVGKYIAAALVWLIALALTFPMVWTVTYLGDPDAGPITCLAVTSAVSAFTRNQVVCFIVSVAVCLLMTLIGFGPVIDWVINWFPGSFEWVVRFVGYLSFMDHFYEMTKGILVLRDVLYFLSVIVVALIITGQALQAKRA